MLLFCPGGSCDFQGTFERQEDSTIEANCSDFCAAHTSLIWCDFFHAERDKKNALIFLNVEEFCMGGVGIQDSSLPRKWKYIAWNSLVIQAHPQVSTSLQYMRMPY
eukprot:TRINITY_DN10251_c0_g2_i2.p1 TRINITY_DN10251_c0_g2~~TRINITY_DN10251_c0_g2_i2.p1  ORF type:complete len:106 (+),score=17.80 TRINITY_DN10251_c0_g2_i2:52-369(+)